MCIHSIHFVSVTGVLGVRVLRVSLDQIAGKVRAVNQDGRYVKTERRAGKIGITIWLLFVAVRRPDRLHHCPGQCSTFSHAVLNISTLWPRALT